MVKQRLGLWLIGARGGVSTTVAIGLSALRQRLTESWGLVSELSAFSRLDLAGWDQITLGGHEVRQGSSVDEAREMFKSNRVFDSSLLGSVESDLKSFDQRIRSGVSYCSGSAIESLVTPGYVQAAQTPRDGIDRIKSDLSDFVQAAKLDRVVVVNLASTEPPLKADVVPAQWSQLEPLLKQKNFALPSSSLYAIAALELGMAYVNFTPSTGSHLPAIEELAIQRRTCHMGRDGKTGETLLKSVLAPMFAARNLEVMSWVGHNIFGNLDGKILDSAENKKAKVASKDQLLKQILNYEPQTLVSIEYIRSLGDWKTAWDHIHFRGFLSTPMVMQFTWQGCDSLLAAPLVLDLFRFVEFAHRYKVVGLMPWLACFFKSPMSVSEHDFHVQFQMLEDWSRQFENRDKR